MSSARELMMSCSRLSFQVRRYHTWPVLQTQTIGDHVGNLLRIHVLIFGSPSSVLTEYYVWHDAGEFKTGDLPFPVKARNPLLKAECDRLEVQALWDFGVKLPQLQPEEKLRVRIVDLMEMLEFGLMERALGNTMAQPVIDDTTTAIVALLPQLRKHSVNEEERVRQYVVKVKSQFRSFGITHARDPL